MDVANDMELLVKSMDVEILDGSIAMMESLPLD